jgi:hypothetical protein
MAEGAAEGGDAGMEEEEVVDRATLYIASREQKQLFGGAKGPLAAKILQLDSDALHSSLIARLTRACDIAPIFKSSDHLCRALPLLLPQRWQRVGCVTAEQIEEELAHPSVPGAWFSRENISLLWRHLGTFSDLSAKHLASPPPPPLIPCAASVAPRPASAATPTALPSSLSAAAVSPAPPPAAVSPAPSSAAAAESGTYRGPPILPTRCGQVEMK